jgi:hypothetical protein
LSAHSAATALSGAFSIGNLLGLWRGCALKVVLPWFSGFAPPVLSRKSILFVCVRCTAAYIFGQIVQKTRLTYAAKQNIRIEQLPQQKRC